MQQPPNQPLPGGFGAQAQQQYQQQQRQQQPARPNQQVLQRHGFLYPRWPLLAAVSLTPFVALGYGLEIYFDHYACRFGALCSLDSLPGVLQVILIWLVYLFLWVIMLAFGVSQGIGGNTIVTPRSLTWLNMITQVETIRWFLVIVGSTVAALMALAVLRQRLDVPSLAFGGIGLAMTITGALYRDHPPQAVVPADQYAVNVRQASSFLGVLRSIPPLSWFFHPRANNPQNTPNQRNQGGQQQP